MVCYQCAEIQETRGSHVGCSSIKLQVSQVGLHLNRMPWPVHFDLVFIYLVLLLLVLFIQFLTARVVNKLLILHHYYTFNSQLNVTGLFFKIMLCFN